MHIKNSVYFVFFFKYTCMGKTEKTVSRYYR